MALANGSGYEAFVFFLHPKDKSKIKQIKNIYG